MRVLPALLALCGAAAAKKVVSIGFGKQGNRLPPVHKRADPISQQLNNNLTGGGYYAEVSLGTPPQPVTLIVDTGSSDVWVLDSEADLCTDEAMQEMYYGGCIATCECAICRSSPARGGFVFARPQEVAWTRFCFGSGLFGPLFRAVSRVRSSRVPRFLRVGRRILSYRSCSGNSLSLGHIC
jgi:hypothetical protein